MLGTLYPTNAYNQHLCRPMLQTPRIHRYNYSLQLYCTISPWVFSRFLNCKNGTKSRKASRMIVLHLSITLSRNNKNKKRKCAICTRHSLNFRDNFIQKNSKNSRKHLTKEPSFCIDSICKEFCLLLYFKFLHLHHMELMQNAKMIANLTPDLLYLVINTRTDLVSASFKHVCNFLIRVENVTI